MKASRVFFPLFLLLCGKGMAQRDHGLFVKYMHNMSERWELTDSTRHGRFRITAYKPVFVTAGRWSSSPNTRPVSENPSYSMPVAIPYNNYEAKFQFSLKTKLARGMFWNHGDLWLGYTQKAHWQVYNEKLSRPFRELNYEPELILNFATNYNFLGMRGRMVGVSLNHQSNGRTLPLSRSWNRIIFHAGFEAGRWQWFIRPWIRLHDEEDENPAITDYYGRAESVVIFNYKRHQFYTTLTHSLKLENGGRGSVLFNWTFPVFDDFRGCWQIGYGYGETLIDYNHKQTTIGLGISLMDW